MQRFIVRLTIILMSAVVLGVPLRVEASYVSRVLVPIKRVFSAPVSHARVPEQVSHQQVPHQVLHHQVPIGGSLAINPQAAQNLEKYGSRFGPEVAKVERKKFFGFDRSGMKEFAIGAGSAMAGFPGAGIRGIDRSAARNLAIGLGGTASGLYGVHKLKEYWKKKGGDPVVELVYTLDEGGDAEAPVARPHPAENPNYRVNRPLVPTLSETLKMRHLEGLYPLILGRSMRAQRIDPGEAAQQARYVAKIPIFSRASSPSKAQDVRSSAPGKSKIAALALVGGPQWHDNRWDVLDPEGSNIIQKSPISSPADPNLDENLKSNP